MLKPELYKKTVDILVDAYFNDMLTHCNCLHCAVGNICKPHAHKIGADGSEWASIFYTDSEKHLQLQAFDKGSTIPVLLDERDKGLKLIEATGYTSRELAKIEYSFETAPKGKSKDEWMFNGLMAVIDVLDTIHENKDTEVTTKSKSLFCKI